jgi:Zn finger protein HypA/HybF involved in hydrogenase expression
MGLLDRLRSSKSEKAATQETKTSKVNKRCIKCGESRTYTKGLSFACPRCRDYLQITEKPRQAETGVLILHPSCNGRSYFPPSAFCPECGRLKQSSEVLLKIRGSTRVNSWKEFHDWYTENPELKRYRDTGYIDTGWFLAFCADCALQLEPHALAVGITQRCPRCGGGAIELVLGDVPSDELIHSADIIRKPDVIKMKTEGGVCGLIEVLAYEEDFWVRRKAAYALGKLGDKRAIRPLTQSLRDGNSDVREAAAHALKNICEPPKKIYPIKELGGGVGRPNRVVYAPKTPKMPVPRTGPTPLRIKTIRKTRNAYVDSCFEIEFEEFADPRIDSHHPEVGVIHEKFEQGAIEEAYRLSEAFRDKYPDFDLPYLWLADLYCKQGRYDEARNATTDGLQRAKAKYRLCHRRGYVEWKTNNVERAAKWWIKSIIIQISTKNLSDWAPFLYLSYIAEFNRRLFDAADRLLRYVDRIGTGKPRLNPTEAAKLRFDARRCHSDVQQAIAVLYKEYLV